MLYLALLVKSLTKESHEVAQKESYEGDMPLLLST
jgi:hypothetical protein